VALPIERDNRSTRDRILDAALAAFADRGVEATSLDSLAAEIGVRKQTILYWFPSKEQLLLGVVDHAVAELATRLSEAAAAARPSSRQRPVTTRTLPKVPTPDVAASTAGPTSNSPSRASNRRRFDAQRAGLGPAPALGDQLVAVVDATFRLGTTRPQLLAVVREVARVGPPASTRLAAAVEPLVETAAAALGGDVDRERIRQILLSAGAQVVGLATEAEVRGDLGLAPDLPWLRTRRRALIESLLCDLGGWESP